jgi:alpha-methylacyl-CoA racemase
MAGPLTGFTIVELAGLGPAPYAGMLLADLGADVVRVDRTDGPGPVDTGVDLFGRGKRSVGIDLKSPEGRELVLRLVEGADGLIEGFRPGVTERLGVGPGDCMERNPGLVYGRMTGWGQEGPSSTVAGHDIDYLAVAGALHPIGTEERPVPPLNLVADFGGGGMFLVVGMVAALLARERGSAGQVIDTAMVDGVAHLTTMVHAMHAAGLWSPVRRSNLLDGGAPFYDVYECADGQHVAVGALEPRFFAELLEGLAIDPASVPGQHDRGRWPELRLALADAFRSATREDWQAVFEGTDACVAPVLSVVEAPHHPHLAARGTFVTVGEVVQPAPAPRFGGTPTEAPRPAGAIGAHTDEILRSLGVGTGDIGRLRDSGIVR